MIKRLSRTELRKKRHLRLKKKVVGTEERPRVSVFVSRANLYMQLVDDTKGHTVYTLSSLSKEFKEKKLKGSKDMEAARALAEMFAQKVKEKDVTRVVFDRSGYRYHGKVKAMAEALRGQGLLG